MKIIVEQIDEKRRKELGIDSWSIWEKGVSEFDWKYSAREICYILEGRAIVTTPDGNSAEFGKGDLVTFPIGLSCRWKIIKAVRKHYKFG